MTTSIIYNLVPFGIILLLVYIFIDIFLDYFRKSENNKMHRLVFYGFFLYLINFIQIKWGGIIFPTKNADILNVYVSSSNSKVNTLYEALYSAISGYNPSAIIYSMLLWIPIGVFISVISNKGSTLLIIFMSCLALELIELVLAQLGFILKYTSILNIFTLASSILGGVIGMWVVRLFSKQIRVQQQTQ
ncbi:hypothetical protein [Bacillus ndiopicus]|uniref:hypothetical protein n=1 Tax=Bacillus ndiopicus TaxID=1347368 RepID=UPI0005A83681|nr:hypothetical protein [Bacillus ndiopicus]